MKRSRFLHSSFFFRITVEKKMEEFIIKEVTARMWISAVVLRRQVDKRTDV